MASDFGWAPLLGAGGYSFSPEIPPTGFSLDEVPPLAPPLTPTALAHVQLAAAAAEVQARAQAHIAQAAQLMLNLPRPEAMAPIPAAEALHQPSWQPGMTLRLAAAGLTPPAPPAGRPAAARALAAKPPARGKPPAARPRAAAERAPPPPQADDELKRQRKDNLRHHLQEMRAEDPRCIFIARRINKLGFRSKALLEKHYSKFGEVTKIMVAHSKVKPDPGSSTMPRTRPGNFGLVVMRSPEAVTRILEQGSEQIVGDFAIQVHQFQAHLFEDVAAGKDGEREPPEATAQAMDAEELPTSSSMNRQQTDDSVAPLPASSEMNRQQTDDSAGSCETGNSGDGALETPDGSSGNSRSSASCNADEDSQEQASTRSTTCTNMSRMDLSAHLSALGGNSASGGSNYKASSSSYDRHGSNGNRSNGSDDYSSQGGSSGGSGRRRDAASLAQASLTKQALDDAARQQPHGSLVEMLNELGRIAKDPRHISSFTKEQSAEAASLAHWAQRSLVDFEHECLSKIDELNSLTDKAAPRGGAVLCAKGDEAARTEACAEGLSAGPKKRGSGGKRGAGGARLERSAGGAVAGCGLPLEGPDADGTHRDTLRSHLTELLTEDPNCVFITRRINKLGFRSREILKRHYSQNGGEVLRVLVAHSKVKPFRDSSGQMRTRPGGLGLIVMKNAQQVRDILALGEEQDVAGQQIRVHCFERPKVDEAGLEWSGGSGESTAAGGATSRSTRSQRSGSNGNGSDSNGGSGSCSAPKETSGSDEGSGSPKRAGRGSGRAGKAREGSSDEKSEEAGSSGPESQEGSR